MRPDKPDHKHPPEVHAAIAKEHGYDPVRMAQLLQQLGWTLADAAWAAVNWETSWLAAAIANEKVARGMKPTSLSESALEKLKVEITAGKPLGPPKPRRTNRIQRAPKIPDKSKGT